MMRLLCFIVAVAIVGCLENPDIIILHDYEVVHIVDNQNTCSREDAIWWANDFENCFRNRKYKNSPDLFNIVVRLLDHSKTCIKFATQECRPSYDDFLYIMDKVIKMVKEYSNMHVERLMNSGVIALAEKDKIKDLNCVENSLTKDIYATCFSDVIETYEELLGENETYDLIFQKDVEKAILCTNKAIKQCSKHVRMDINKVVRYVLGVKQPDHDIEADRTINEPSEFMDPPMLSSELSETGRKSIDDKTEFLKVQDSTEFPNPTRKDNEPDSTEPLNSTSTLKVLISPKPEDLNSTSFGTLESNFGTEIEEHTDILHWETTKDPEITENIEPLELSLFTDSSMLLETINPSAFPNTKRKDNHPYSTELPASTSTLKASTSPKLEDLLNSTSFGTLEGNFDAETGEHADISDWETTEDPEITEPLKLSLSTDSSMLFETFNASEFPNAKRKDNHPYSTDLPASTSTLKASTSPKLEDLLNSTSFGTLEGNFDAETGEHADISDWETTEDPEITKTTEPLKFSLSRDSSMSLETFNLPAFPKAKRKDNHPYSTELPPSTSTLKASISPKHKDLSNSTNSGTSKVTPLSAETGEIDIFDLVTKSTKFIKSTNLPKYTASTKFPKLSDLSKTNVRPKITKSTGLPRSTASAKPPKTTRRPRSTMSIKPPKESRPVYTQPIDTYFERPRPTESPRRWYDFIVQPFVRLWRTVKSWFGF